MAAVSRQIPRGGARNAFRVLQFLALLSILARCACDGSCTNTRGLVNERKPGFNGEDMKHRTLLPVLWAVDLIVLLFAFLPPVRTRAFHATYVVISGAHLMLLLWLVLTLCLVVLTLRWRSRHSDVAPDG